MRAVPWWGVVSSAAAPVLLIGGWTVAAALQPGSFNAVAHTISALAAQGAADRWVMTLALVGVGACFVMTGLALRPAAAPGRIIVLTGGVATVLAAANPEPAAGGGSVPHTFWAGVGFVALATWPVGARRRGRSVPYGLRAAVSTRAVGVLLGLALSASCYGVVNAAWTRVKRVTVKLPNLPAAWRGRVAALVSDTHLGHVRGYRFMRRIVQMLIRLRPDIVFIAGDMYDGTAAKVDELASPWTELAAPLGAYFVTGNHEEFSDPAKYLQAVKQAGVRVLNNEKVVIDGLQIVGAHFRESTNDERLRTVLRGAALDRDRASILLTHAPDRLKIAEARRTRSCQALVSREMFSSLPRIFCGFSFEKSAD